MATPQKVMAEAGADLIRIHSLITRALETSIDRSKVLSDFGLPVEDVLKGFVIHLECLLTMLHSHHTTEDEVAFPNFKKIIPDAPYDLLTAQHREIAPILVKIYALIKRLREAPDTSVVFSDIGKLLVRLYDIWRPHIKEEESYFGPDRLDTVLDMEERVRLGKLFSAHAQETSKSSDAGLMMLPFILYNLPPEDRAVMAETMPPLDALMSRSEWEPLVPFLAFPPG